ncbi:MAG: glycosyltransferase [Kiritimatiellae bacterium]|nr:glycosyltransferase [Kiritimatiellia bacterium]
MSAITVVMPVFNAAAYLEEALGSLRSQTFTDWDCVCVDDGSTDGSAEILARAAAADPRFSVTTQSNHGLSHARNTGFDMAKGTWLTFLDADDLLDQAALGTLHSLAERAGADVAWGQYSRSATGPGSGAEMVFDGRSLERLLERRFGCGRPAEKGRPFDNVPMTVWNKLYSRKFLLEHGIRHEDAMRRGEDIVFQARVMRHARRVAATDAVTYLYRFVPGSLFLSGTYSGLSQMVASVVRFAEENAGGRPDLRGFLARRWTLSWLRAALRCGGLADDADVRRLFADDCLRLADAFAGCAAPLSRVALAVAPSACQMLFPLVGCWRHGRCVV